MRAPFQVADCRLVTVSPHGREQKEQASSRMTLIKDTNPIREGSTLMNSSKSIFQRPHLLITIMLVD